jgi:predicted DNA-binding protein YlxM (UPF0122 family)
MKPKEQAEARRLRRDEGLSLKEIAERLSVSKSSVSAWVRDIELTPEQHLRLSDSNRLYGRQALAHAAWNAHHRERRQAAQAEGRRLARAGDPFHAAGCMLFWAEGSKSRNQMVFSNSDPNMVRFYVAFLRRYFQLEDEAITIRCYLYCDHTERQIEIENFWLETLDLPRDSLRKTMLNRYSRSSSRKRTNMLPYGTCHVVVNRTHVVQGLYGAIQEYVAFTRDAWLD